MRRSHQLLLTGLLVAAMAGCLPEKRVLWSPDGTRALLRGDDGLYLCDATGKLSARLVENAGSVVWLPDSSGVVFSRHQAAKSWTDMAAVLTAEQRSDIESRGAKLRAEVLAHEGPWDTFKPSAIQGLSGGEALALFLYMREQHSAGLPEKLGDKWQEFQRIEGKVYLLERATVSVNGVWKAGPVLHRAVDDFEELRVSPDGRLLAFRRPMGNEDSTQRLYVMPVDGQVAPRAVAAHISLFYDWSPDGKALVYAATKDPLPPNSDELRLGTLKRQVVCAADGTLFEDLPAAEELAGLVFQRELRVRCLRDGRIIFACLEMQLPCTAKDMPDRVGLFAVEPQRHPGVTRLIPRQVQADLPAIALFEISPDEQRVSIADTDGRVVVLDLASGGVCEVVSAEEVDHLRAEPSWRSPAELCFVTAPPVESGQRRGQVVLARLDWEHCTASRSVLSDNWPKATCDSFLGDSSSGQTPANQSEQSSGNQ